MVKLDAESKTVTIQCLKVDDFEFYQDIEKIQDVDRLSFIRDSLILGAQVFNRVQIRRDADWFQKQMIEYGIRFTETLDERLEDVLGKVKLELNPEKDGSALYKLTNIIEGTKAVLLLSVEQSLNEITEQRQQLSTQIASTFDTNIKSSHASLFQQSIDDILQKFQQDCDVTREGSVLNDFASRLEAIFYRELSTESGSPLQKMKDEIVSIIVELKTEIQMILTEDRAIESIEQKTSRKGVKFEDEAMEVLCSIARHRNDTVEDVGATPKKGGSSKKGDIVYTEAITGLSVTVEAKDYSTPFATKKIKQIVEDAMKNRGSEFGIFLVKNRDCLPESYGAFHIEANYIVCTLSFLEIAIKWACLLLQSRALRPQEGLDLKVLYKIFTVLKRDAALLDEILAHSESVNRSNSKISETASRLRSSIIDGLGRASEMLTSCQADTASERTI